MSKKYYYLNERILKNWLDHQKLKLSDIFLGIRAGSLLMIAFFLGNFIILNNQSTQLPKILNPVLGAAANQSVKPTTIPDFQSEIFPPQTTPTHTPTAIPTPTNQPPKQTAKSSYSIAVFGDSMIDTMGERLEYLEQALKNKYPRTNFSLYNFGVGAQNVEEGLARLHQPLNYKDRHYPPLDEIKPDLIIIGSFAYNPFSPHDRNRYWAALNQLVNEVKSISPQVYLLAEIAPLKNNFGQGPNGVNWDQTTSYQHATNIIDLLENAVNLSSASHIPLINAFNPSQISPDKSGNPRYVNSSDGIHPSIAGHQFMAEKIAQTISLD